MTCGAACNFRAFTADTSEGTAYLDWPAEVRPTKPRESWWRARLAIIMALIGLALISHAPLLAGALLLAAWVLALVSIASAKFSPVRP